MSIHSNTNKQLLQFRHEWPKIRGHTRDVVELVRLETGLSHAASQSVVQTVLGYVCANFQRLDRDNEWVDFTLCLNFDWNVQLSLCIIVLIHNLPNIFVCIVFSQNSESSHLQERSRPLVGIGVSGADRASRCGGQHWHQVRKYFGQENLFIQLTFDFRAMEDLFEQLTRCKDDEQQRNWMLYEDETTIRDLLQVSIAYF